MRIGEDAAPREMELVISGQDVATCTLRRTEDGTWRGAWLHFEKMPVELTPQPARVGRAPAREGHAFTFAAGMPRLLHQIWLGGRTLVSERLAAGRAANSGVAMGAGDERGATGQVVLAVERLGGLLRNAVAFYSTIPAEDIPESEVLDALVTYGWEGGRLGNLESASRVVAQTELALAVTASLPAALRYPASVLTRLVTWLGVYHANKLLAGGGTLQTVIADKDGKRALVLRANARVRHHYCAASDDGEYSVELARIGDQPKRAPGEAQPAPLPDAAGAATLNAATRELTIAALPAHATSLVAFRQPAGGDAEQAGVSTTNVVGVSDFSPLVPGVSYTVWVKGRNSRGFGAESNRITFAA